MMRALALLFALTALAPAAAAGADAPYLWVKPSVGAAYGPLGLIGDVKVQARAPLHRSESIVFRDTYAGVGGRVSITPAFVDVGPRFSLAPIDVFDVDFQLGWAGIWPSSSGLLPYSKLGGKLDSERDARADTARSGHLLYAAASPTFKLKVGPLIAFTSAELAVLHVPGAGEERFLYEARRDLLIAPTEFAVSSWTAVLAEILDGEATPVLLRAGGLLRHRQAMVSGDVSTSVGGLVSVKPGRKPGWPTVTLVVLGYLRDADRALSAPNVQLQVGWELERPLRRQGAS